MTIAKAYGLFCHDRAVYCSAATLKKYQGDLTLFFSFLEERTSQAPEDLSFPAFNIYQEYILYMRKRNVRPVTIRSYCRSVRAFLKWCYDFDYCPDYLKRVQLPKDDARPKLPLYQDEVKRIDACFDVNTLAGLRNYCIIHLMLDCGLRTQEVAGLCLEHVLKERNVLQLLDSKGNKSRMTLIPDFLLETLSDYCSIAGIQHGRLFHSLKARGEPLTGNGIKQLCQQLKKASGIPRVHAHLFRHTFATSYLLGGGNLEFLRVFMGHYDYTVTKTYSQLAAEMKMLGADIYQLDRLFFTRGY